MPSETKHIRNMRKSYLFGALAVAAVAIAAISCTEQKQEPQGLVIEKQGRDFAKQYNADGGDATVIYLPDENIHGNSHFMFQEKNNAEIADLIAGWLEKHNL